MIMATLDTTIGKQQQNLDASKWVKHLLFESTKKLYQQEESQVPSLNFIVAKLHSSSTYRSSCMTSSATAKSRSLLSPLTTVPYPSSSKLSVLTWTITLLLILSFLSISNAVEKKAYFHTECKGKYSKSIYARVDRLCYDCYNVFRDPDVYTLCRQDCFTSMYFKACIELLQETEQMHQLQMFVLELNGVDIRV